MRLTRRNLLGATGALGSAGLAVSLFPLGPVARAIAQTPAPAAAAVDLASWTGTVAHADTYGPFIATVTNGRLTQVTPTAADKRPTLMLTEGMLARTYDKTRIAGPMVRKSYLEAVQSGGSSKPELRGKDDWVQVSWDTAIGLSAKAILDTIEKHGNEGCFSSSYGGWAHGGIFRPQLNSRRPSWTSRPAG